MKKTLKELWHTDCQFCRKARMTILWLVLMMLADVLWFHLIF
ncbi:hypothetical protein [Thalassotalea profundi]|nr:hypothetical protein [Thalassotalea profundi]